MSLNRKDEYEFYKDPNNQIPKGMPRRRKSALTELVPIRFSEETLTEIRRLADEDDRSVSSWIRQAVVHELETKHSA